MNTKFKLTLNPLQQNSTFKTVNDKRLKVRYHYNYKGTHSKQEIHVLDDFEKKFSFVAATDKGPFTALITKYSCHIYAVLRQENDRTR